MYEDLIIKVRKLNDYIKDNMKELDSIGRDKLKADIYSKIATRYEMKESAKLDEINKAGGLWAVDGSLNKIGALYPHYIGLIDALLISTKDGYEKRLSDVYSPMTSMNTDFTGEESIKSEIFINTKMATFEVQVCLDALEEKKPRIIFMDGGFIRYIISCEKEFNELKEACIDNDIILVGVIEEIKTSIIANYFGFHHYDREVLYSLLDYKEAMIIKDEYNNKNQNEQHISSAFVRASMAPYAIGVDMLTEQREFMEDVLDIILSLTPKSSRGIPLILDMVDKKVKISDEVKQAILIKELDRDVYDRCFNEVRNLR